MQPITNEDIRADIEGFRARITKAQKKLNEMVGAETRKDRLKEKQLRDEVSHVISLIRMAEGALTASSWDGLNTRV